MSAPTRIVVASIGWAGHAFPAFALTRELRARGHEVTVETFARWREVVEGRLGAAFRPAPERIAFGGLGGHGDPTMAEVARRLAVALGALRAEVVVSDLFTLAPALAAELTGVPRASLIPHPYPERAPGLPPYPLGLAPPRTALGRLAWSALGPVAGPRLPNTRLRRVRASIDAVRGELRLAPLTRDDGQISEELALVATYPQLEYPREWPAGAHVVGPLPFELPHPEVELPPGEEPLVVVAASTERDPGMRLIRTALAALADEPVRVLASTNRPGARPEGPVPANARVYDWVPYGQALAEAALMLSHGGHGTVARALGAGVPVVVCPPAGDMAVNGARVAWAGAGAMLPDRLLSSAALRASVRAALADPGLRRRAGEIAAWGRGHDGAATAADLIEALAGERRA